MIDAINTKLTSFYTWLKEEHGQTTAEYVTVTAVGVALATVILWAALGGAIGDAIDDIASAITDFTASPPVIS